MFPMIPSYNLKKLHELIKDQLPPIKKNLWQTYKEIVPAIIKQAKNPSYTIDVKLSTYETLHGTVYRPSSKNSEEKK